MNPNHFISGILLAASPIPFAVAVWTRGPVVFLDAPSLLIVAALTSVSLLFSAFLLPRAKHSARLFAVLGLLGLGVLAWPAMDQSPALTLLLTLIATFILGSLWNSFPFLYVNPPMHRVDAEGDRIQGASVFVLCYGFVSLFQPWESNHYISILVSYLCVCILLLLLIPWMIQHRRLRSTQTLLAVSAAVLFLVAFLIAQAEWHRCFTIALVIPLATLLVFSRSTLSLEKTGLWDLFLTHTERLFVATFLLLSLLGTFLLVLPISSAKASAISVVDAAFTSISAVCVTGLIVLDTPHDFSWMGQFILLMLIQIGGLGIMTFSTLGLRILGSRLSLRYERTLARVVSTGDRSRMFETAAQVLKLTFVAELVGTLILFLPFRLSGDSTLAALWRALFTSVSSFCNAGFALQTDSLMSYSGNPLVLHTIAALIILGGLSPIVVLSIPTFIRRSTQPVPAQIKIALWATVTLLFLGFLGILSLEWSHTLGGMGFWDRLHNAWFQSATLRTAGFNSIDIAAIRSPTLLLVLAWMFIGGNPGGTAGGIKTTTAAVLGLAAYSALRGEGTIVVFGRHVSSRTTYRAIAILLGALAILTVSFLALQLTQDISIRLLLFEVVSAFGTVGLSQGATGQLDAVGKVLIMACMFVGRVGPLTFFMVLHRRHVEGLVKYPLEDISVG